MVYRVRCMNFWGEKQRRDFRTKEGARRFISKYDLYGACTVSILKDGDAEFSERKVPETPEELERILEGEEI